MAKKKFTFIDLFAGCGGLSEGFLQTGRFEALAHVEWEMPMVNTLRNRLVQKWNHSEQEAKERVVCFDIQKTDELINGGWSDESKRQYGVDNADLVQTKGLKGIVEGEELDLIIGGPPCQAYSIAGRAQDPNSMQFDYRNYLFESFVKVVDAFKPKAFVFENVPGLLSACPGGIPVKNRIFDAFEAIGYNIRTPEKLKDSVYCAEDYETPQKRNRIIIVGTRNGGTLDIEEIYASLTQRKASKITTVKDAIGEMPKFKPLDVAQKIDGKNVSHVVIGENPFSLNEARYHSKRDIEVFRKWLAKDMNHASTEARLSFYTQITGKKSNHIKYRNLEWDKPSPTVVAHLYKDGLMFIHPDQNQLRSITIREAACLQSFPLDFMFLGSTAYCFKMIGNAVPVAFARNIAFAITDVLDKKI
ncbi:MAG: DNA cytosine methyltransferase [Bacteroidales bacterium]|nr:DNA cytosine methyltransferase [Bacteroidales bacterium]